MPGDNLGKILLLINEFVCNRGNNRALFYGKFLSVLGRETKSSGT